MRPSSRRSLVPLVAIALSIAFASPGVSAQAQAQAKPPRSRVVFQVTEGDPARWNLVLNNVKNLQAELADEGSDIEVVVYGPGIGMLKADSAVRTRVAEARAAGVRVVACENTMKAMKLGPAEMMPEIGYVPAGVVEVVRKQQQGWAYVRP